MRRGRRISLFSAAGAAVALLMSGSVVTASVFPYGTIVFVSNRDWLAGTPGSDIYTMNSDGTMVTRLTNDALQERDPVLSPDGSKIAYEIGGHIFVRDVTGGTPVDLLAGCGDPMAGGDGHLCGYAAGPAWSPDGTRIAFALTYRAGSYAYSAIETVRLADHDRQTVFNGNGLSVKDPTWTLPADREPGQERIAFVQSSGAVDTILIKDLLDGQTETLATGSMPAWSPDGSYIAFVDDLWTHGAYPHPAANGLDIYVAPACRDCSGEPFPPSMAYGRDLHPSWSPDGTKILFQSERWDNPTAATGNGVYHLYMVDVFPWDDPYPGYVFPDEDLTLLSASKAGQAFPTTYSDTLASWHWPLYDISGFFSPVNDWNGVKAGKAVPIKFSLGGDQGLDIFAAGYPRSVAGTCEAGGVAGDAVETVTAGGSSLTYDAVADQYVYVWKTDKSWAGQCREFQLQFRDGTFVTAKFSFWR